MNGCFFTDHKRYHNLASLTKDKKKHCSDTYICMSTICFMFNYCKRIIFSMHGHLRNFE